MEKRTLLAVVLSLVVLMVWQTWFIPQPEVSPQEPVPGAGTPVVDGGSSADSVSGRDVETAVENPTPAAGPRTDSLSPIDEDIPAQEAVVERADFTAVFTNEGGGIRSWRLKDYTEYRPGEGPLDVVRNILASEPVLHPYDTPMDLLAGPYVNATPFRLNGGVSPDEKERRCRLGRQDDSGVEFLCREGQLSFSKQYLLGEDPYLLHLVIVVTNGGSEPASLRPTLGVRGWVPAKKRRTFAPTSAPMYLVDGEAERVDVDDVREQRLTITGRLEWAGIDDKYFLRAVLPELGSRAAVTLAAGQPVASKPDADDVAGERVPLLVSSQMEKSVLEPGESARLEYRFFLGPKRAEVLKSYDRALEKSLDFGMFGVFAEPILALLKWLYKLVGSYGVAIILLTIIIKTLFYPLMVKQMQSAARMKEFQPQMAELRERYKDDKEKLNQEMMKFMQEKKINPLGGCLPLLLQMPIWFALYRVLQNSIELYHTPFLYLPDLSERDPFGISPLVLGILMFVQQRMTPPAPGMDPTQAKMMQFLPLVFAFIMFSLPSGLVVYILVNTVLTIIQQAYITRRTAAGSAT